MIFLTVNYLYGSVLVMLNYVFHANVKKVYSTFIVVDNKRQFGLTCMLQDASSPVGLIL